MQSRKCTPAFVLGGWYYSLVDNAQMHSISSYPPGQLGIYQKLYITHNATIEQEGRNEGRKNDIDLHTPPYFYPQFHVINMDS